MVSWRSIIAIDAHYFGAQKKLPTVHQHNVRESNNPLWLIGLSLKLLKQFHQVLK